MTLSAMSRRSTDSPIAIFAVVSGRSLAVITAWTPVSPQRPGRRSRRCARARAGLQDEAVHVPGHVTSAP
jgi:hypothetical protein